MEDYLNYWLKKTVKETPNDMELGEKIREMIWVEENKPHNKRDRDDKWIFERNPDTNEIKKRKI